MVCGGGGGDGGGEVAVQSNRPPLVSYNISFSVLIDESTVQKED